jgi:hypothetical protein
MRLKLLSILVLMVGLQVTAALAQQGATVVNPQVGSVWTYMGPTYGAAWSPFPPGTMGATLPTVVDHFAIWNNTTGTLLKDGAGVGVVHQGNTAGNGIFVGRAGETPPSNWLETAVPGSTRYAEVSGLSTIGYTGVLGGARTSDNSIGAYSYGVIGIGLSDAATNRTATGALFQTRNSSSTAGSTLTLEVNSINVSGPHPQMQPYSVPLPSTIGAWLASGDPSFTSLDNSVALGIITNSGATTGKWRSGIVFGASSLVGGTGADGDTTIRDAISLPRLAAINFWNAGGPATLHPSSSIYSAVQSGTPYTQNIKFNGDGLVIEDAQTLLPVMKITSGGTENCFWDLSNAIPGQVAVDTRGVACNATYNTQGASTSHQFFVNTNMIFRVKATGVDLPVLNTGTPVGSLCIDAANNIIKKNTPGPCV